jgi:integrase
MRAKTKKPRKRRGWGRSRVYARGNKWAIRWTEDGQRKSSAGYLTQDTASQVLAGILANIEADRPGVPEKPRPPAPPFGELVDEWLESREQDDHRSVQDDRSRWHRHLGPLLAHRRMDSVDSALLIGLIRDLRNPKSGSLDPKGEPKAKLSNATVGNVMHLLSAFYRWAHREKGVGANPVRELVADMAPTERKRIKSDHDPEKTLFVQTKADIARVYRALPNPVNVAYAISALAGLRPGEVLALEWSDVDLDAATITVRRQVRHGRVDVPKSGKARDVPMVPSLVVVLRKLRAKRPDAVQVVEPVGYKRKDGTVMARRNRYGVSKFLNLRTIYAALSKALAALGLPSMTFYEAGRHSFASQWVLEGLDVYRLSKILGHSSVVVTQRYAHLTKKTPADILARADVKLAS